MCSADCGEVFRCTSLPGNSLELQFLGRLSRRGRGTFWTCRLAMKGAVEGAERIFGVLKGAFECLSSPPMLMFSISYKHFVLWHGNPASESVF
jgi:hypothetical protein